MLQASGRDCNRGPQCFYLTARILTSGSCFLFRRSTLNIRLRHQPDFRPVFVWFRSVINWLASACGGRIERSGRMRRVRNTRTDHEPCQAPESSLLG